MSPGVCSTRASASGPWPVVRTGGDSFGGLVEAAPLDFSGSDGLCRLMRGAGVLYNTIWVRYAHGRTTFDLAVENTRTLLEAAGAGVGRIVHFSVANASTESGLPYTKRLELPVRIAVPRLTEHPTTSRRRYDLLSTLAHLRVLELPAKDGGSKDHNPIDISNRVLPTVKLGPLKRTRTAPTQGRTVPQTTSIGMFCRYWVTGVNFPVSQLPLTLA